MDTLLAADQPVVAARDIALWNPMVVGIWGQVFYVLCAGTPICGSLLLAANWRALGQTRESNKALAWGLLGALVPWGVTFAALALMCVLPENQVVGNVMMATPLLALVGLGIGWHVYAVRPQLAYINDHVGAAYPSRSWVLPTLASAVGALAAATAAFLVLSGYLFLLGLYFP